MLSTTEGTRHEHAFGAVEWGLFAVPPLIWGCSFLFIAVAIEDFAPSVVTAGRVCFGALAIGVLPSARPGIARADWPRVLFLSATWMAIPFACFSVAEQWIDSSLAGMLNGAMPLTTAAVATAMLRRLPGPRQFLGLVVGFAGVTVVMLPALDDDASSSTSGVLLVLLAVVCYGFAANVSVPLQQRYGPVPVLFRSQLGALAMTAPFALSGIGDSTFDGGALAAVVALGALGTGVAFVTLGALLARVGAARGSVAVYLVPVVAVVAGVVFRDEQVAALSLVGMALVAAGAFLTSRAERRPASAPAR